MAKLAHPKGIPKTERPFATHEAKIEECIKRRMNLRPKSILFQAKCNLWTFRVETRRGYVHPCFSFHILGNPSRPGTRRLSCPADWRCCGSNVNSHYTHTLLLKWYEVGWYVLLPFPIGLCQVVTPRRAYNEWKRPRCYRDRGWVVGLSPAPRISHHDDGWSSTLTRSFTR